MMKFFTRWLVLFLLPASLALGQRSVTLTGTFFDYVTFFVSSFDPLTGESDVPIFDYRIEADSYPVEVVVTFDILINSPALGLSFQDKFFHVETVPFILQGALRLKNTDLKNPPDPLYFLDGPHAGEAVSLELRVIETIFDEGSGFDMNDLISQVMQTGRLPDGTYRFDLVLTASQAPGGDPGPWSGDNFSKSVVASNPVSLELIAPGGVLEDTTTNTISTSYPFFQWQSDPCSACEYLVRVAQYKPGQHSSLEDAVEDQTVLPINQAIPFHSVGNATSFQYPFTGAADLLAGKIYVWQVQKSIPTTEGPNLVNSFINVFKILDPTVVSSGTGDSGGDATVEAAQDPLLGFLQVALGDDAFAAYFSSGGDLEGFRPNDVVTLNGVSIEINVLDALRQAMNEGNLTIISVEVQ